MVRGILVRIALFHNLPSGGAKRTVYEQVKRLTQRGHQIDLYSLSTANHDFADVREFARRSIILPFSPGRLFRSPFGRLNQGVRILDLLRLRGVMWALANELDKHGYDVALVHPCMFTFSPIILRYLHTPSLYYRHDPVRWLQDPETPRPYHRNSTWRRHLDRIDPLRNGYYRLLVREDVTSMRTATRVVTNSYFMRESLYRLYGVSPFVCYHGVDTDLFRPLRLPRENFVISAGAIAPKKGYDFIIRSLARIPQPARPRLILVGNAALEEEQRYLAGLAQQMEVEVEFRHLVTDQELVRLYNQALCTVYAPVMEPFGLVPLESMACGTPVVGIREGGVRETVVDGQTGLLADRSPDDFAAAITRLLDNLRLVEELGHQARAYVEQKWHWEHAIDRLESHLQQVAR
ncbi:MAG: glycosyltransferase family 1 protein [Chloroflexi bacterium]|nr:MAG: glycosyltransferase family 1 protein [Chloroflexota bacterium]